MVAAEDAQIVAALLQPKLDALLAPCGTLASKGRPQLDITYWKARFFGTMEQLKKAQKQVFCYSFGILGGSKLPNIPSSTLYDVANRASGWQMALPADQPTVNVVDLFKKYETAREQYALHREMPEETHLSKPIAYLLVAFAFAVRLTKTTLEIFEWHDVTSSSAPISDENSKVPASERRTEKRVFAARQGQTTRSPR